LNDLKELKELKLFLEDQNCTCDSNDYHQIPVYRWKQVQPALIKILDNLIIGFEMKNILVTMHEVYELSEEDIKEINAVSDYLKYIDTCDSKSCIRKEIKDSVIVWHIGHDDFDDHVYDVLNARNLKPSQRY
jgi:hypothetical protein